ncbi:esterase FrsA [Orbus hercynius]|uniref:Esterase FrsA n=1 Tax=Orbus hercynius TaxID=593135 RepID=A0A495RKT9_9GAMM|nr:alpha/beta hydrolase [Orbus hercynius]RKS87398.1 esterase FrsA [Orbus hercynius]
MTEHENRSEKLFTPQFNYPETSALIARPDSNSTFTPSVLDGEARSNWYRVINRMSWHWHGLPLLEVGDVLSRIAVSTRKRSNDNWLDSVIGYQSGNWIYEFLAEAVQWQQEAEKNQSTECNESNCQAWLTASALASLAGYPYFRNDDLANQAQIFANRYYHEAMNASPYQIKELDFKVENKNVKAILHTPSKKNEAARVCPVVFLCAGLSHLQIDFYHYFSRYLAPLGVGLLTVDTPSIGHSKQFNLSQNTSVIHQSILEQIKSVPLIDPDKVILFGYRFGANTATRLAYLMPHKIKGVINIAPIVHQLFIDRQMQAQLSPIYRDIIASRLGLNTVSDQQLMAELQFFSLKEQRLLTKPCRVPMLNIAYEGDMLSSLEEAKLLTSAQKVSLIHIKALAFKQGLQQAAEQSTQWINALIK